MRNAVGLLRFTVVSLQNAEIACRFACFRRILSQPMQPVSCFCVNSTVFYGYLIKKERNTMRIILDTDKKTITVPWNYTAKL